MAGALTLAGVAMAQTVEPENLRIYINPGHGSWTVNDRAMATIKHGAFNPNNTDTTGFFESNTNLWKGLALLDRLASYGIPFDRTLNQNNSNPARRGAALDLSNNLVMSHVKLGPYPHNSAHASDYNRDLYEIACEVELNNFDFFISVHSNAHVDGYNTNYPAFFVRGENKTALTPGSDEAAKVVWPFAYQDEHNCWSNFSMTSPGIYYDIDFWNGDYLINNIGGKSYKGYYGVLRHGVLGFLVEGYFHTYQPARHRAMNPDVCRHEGDCYAHGLAALFGLSTESTGEIYGIVRDKHESFRHSYYSCSKTSYDNLKPLNNVDVKLYKDGVEVASYKTDDEWNGAFLFKDLEPGEYTISAVAEGYKPAHGDFCGPFTVEAAKTVYPRVYLESESYIPPSSLYKDYPDEAADVEAIPVLDTYTFKKGLSDKVITALKNKTIRRFINYGNRLYVLAVDADRVPTVVVIDTDRFTVLTTVRTTGCEGTEYALSDIAVTSDGVLIGCAMELNHLTADYVEEGEERGVCNIYRWQNDQSGLPTGAPKIWFTTQMTGNLYRAWTGETMAYTGTLSEGRMLLSSASWYYSHSLFFTIIDIYDEKKDSESFSNKGDVTDYFNMDNLGEGYRFNISPLSSESFIANSAAVQPRQYTIDNMHVEGELSSDIIPAAAAQSGYFRYAGRSMMVAPRVDANGASCGIDLYEITDGLNAARKITVNNIDMPAIEGKAAAAGRTIVTRDDDGNVTGADMVLYMIREGGRLSRYSTEGVEQASVQAVVAPADDAPVQYFNLQGIQVDANNLTPGIYIRRQGATVTKVIMR